MTAGPAASTAAMIAGASSKAIESPHQSIERTNGFGAIDVVGATVEVGKGTALGPVTGDVVTVGCAAGAVVVGATVVEPRAAATLPTSTPATEPFGAGTATIRAVTTAIATTTPAKPARGERSSRLVRSGFSTAK